MSSPESGITRRDFLKKAGTFAAVGAVAGAAGLIIDNEINKDGIVRVNEGNFIPLYENHVVGIAPEDIPQSIDALFKESGNIVADDIESQLGMGYKTDIGKTMEILAGNKAPVILGDIRPTNSYLLNVGLFVLTYAAEFWIGLRSASKILHTRRKVLKLALGAAALFGLSNFTALPALISRPILPSDWNRKLSRIYGITSHMHPEQPALFLRNALMADKLLLTGAYLKEKLGRQPNVAFQVGLAHSGIEDFLQAGQEACRKAIALYPKPYLNYVIKINGGAEDFSSALLAYPKVTDENQYTFDLVKITDQKLLESLRS